ncbi:hypothetical protein [Lentzea sp. NPDC051838]|uniref:hypothetical protein n=1 Tax=Lentzea sp. NPDC051838 TaxID=3154849 RepID=UPI0034273C11
MDDNLTWIGRALFSAALACVLFVAVGVAVMWVVVDATVYQPDDHDDWALRGELAADEALLDRAEQVWRDTGVPVGDVEPVYAGRSSSLPVNVVLVALAGETADERPVVAFVTSPATTGTPSSDQLFVRALSFPDPEPMAIGFIANRQDPADAPIPDGGSLAFALAAPGLPSMLFGGGSSGEIIWRILPRGEGAWNRTITTYTDEDSDGRPTWPGAGVRDTAMTAAPVSSEGDTITARYPKPAVGDLIVNWHVLVGVVVDDSGRVDISPITQPGKGTVRIGSADVPGVLKTRPNGTLTFTPTGPAELKSGDPVDFTTSSGVVVRLGWLTENFKGEWDVGRGIRLPLRDEDAVAISPR